MGSIRRVFGEVVGDDRRPGALIVLGQVSFLVFLALAVALHPGFVLKADEGGISNYGIHLKTVVPYSLAFVLCAYFSIRAAGLCRGPGITTRRFRYLLTVYACLLLLTLLSTYGYRLDVGLKEIHVAAGVTTVAFEVAASVWMYAQLRGGWDAVFLAVQLVGSAVAGLTVLGVGRLLFLGQAVASMGFALLLIRTGQAVPPSGPGPGPEPHR